MLAKITAYNKDKASGGCSDFSLNTYWGDEYKNVFYICGDFGRPTFEDIVEVTTDITGQDKRIQNTSIERFNLTAVVSSPLLAFLKTLDKHEVKTLTLLDTGDSYEITNIDIEDDGGALDPIQKVIITFEDEPISLVTDNDFENPNGKLAYWDNNDDGTKDLNGTAEFNAPTMFANPTDMGFQTQQLYFESDGVTPATSGDVLIVVKALRDTGAESLIGIFQGEFGDSFSNSTKWQTTSNIYDYFDLADTVGHTNRILFDKEAFARDNGFFSTETEDRAVEMTFEISIDGSPKQKTTLERVYAVWGAFCSFGVQDGVSGRYGVTTIHKFDSLGIGGIGYRKTTLSTVSDIVKPAGGGGTPAYVTLANVYQVFPHKIEYSLGTAPSGEQLYSGALVTSGGYESRNTRGAYDEDNFTFAPNPDLTPTQTPNLLTPTSGTSPYIVEIPIKYDRITGAGGYPDIGDLTGDGDAEWYFDGVLQSNFPGILVSTTQSFPVITVTLPDTDVHTVKVIAPTTSGIDIFTEFQLQLKPLF